MYQTCSHEKLSNREAKANCVKTKNVLMFHLALQRRTHCRNRHLQKISTIAYSMYSDVSMLIIKKTY